MFLFVLGDQIVLISKSFILWIVERFTQEQILLFDFSNNEGLLFMIFISDYLTYIHANIQIIFEIKRI